MPRFIFTLFLFLVSISASALDGKILSLGEEPIVGASVVIQNADSVFVSGASSSTDGRFHIDVDVYPIILKVSYIGYETYQLRLESAPSEEVVIYLKESNFSLDEVVVTAEMMEHFDSHTTYHLKKIDLERFPTFGQALNVIPFVTATADGAISYKGDTRPVLLLNGVKTTREELRALDKNNVAKVEVYENPPAQYALMGATTVINVVLRKNITGGNLALDLSDSFYPIYGNNSVSVFYHHGNSQWKAQYSNNIKHYKRTITDESLQYELNGVHYEKIKSGLSSPSTTDNHSLSLGYMANLKENAQFNLNLSYANNCNDRETRQKVVEKEICSSDFSHLKSDYQKYSINAYFSKQWEGGRNLMTDATATFYKTDFHSQYQKDDAQGEEIFRSSASYNTDRFSFLSTLQYALPSKIGTWTFGAKDDMSQSRQIEGASSLLQTNNTLYFYGQLYGQKGKFYYQAIAAAKQINIWKDGQIMWNKLSPSPTVRLWFRPTNKITAQFAYTYTQNLPSVALMSQTMQWLDTQYAYMGNASLQPYGTHQIMLALSAVTNHINVSAVALHNHVNEAIVNVFKNTGDYILQTYDNLHHLSETGGQLTLDIFPLKDKRFKLSTTAIYLTTYGKENDGGSWHGKRYQLMCSAMYNIYSWDFQIDYQYPGETMQGQLVTPRAQALSLDISYKPNSNLAVGITWHQPFMNGLKEGEYTLPSALLQTNRTFRTGDWQNMICFHLVYNFHFGYQKTFKSQIIKGEDRDAGILVK